MNFDTIRLSLLKYSLFCFAVLLIAACSQSEQQQNFKKQALSKPAGIKAMNANGAPAKNGETDPDDWRIAPDFSGLVKVTTPAFPNPVSFNASFEIDLNITGIDAVNGLQVYAFRQQSDLATANPLIIRQKTLQPGLQALQISPQQFAHNGGAGTIDDTYRIIMYDGQNNIITYGDVLVK